MSSADNESRKRVPHPLSKEERAKDAALAMKDYEAAKKSELDKTARLRELRLARDAKITAEPPKPAKSAKRPKKAKPAK